SFFAPRRLAACALPRPSATASAKLANSTVNHSHTEIAAVNASRSTTARIAVSSAPIHVTNITGLRHCAIGVNRFSESIAARLISAGSNVLILCSWRLMSLLSLLLREQHQVLDDRPERERGHERQRADQQHRADQQRDKQRRVRRQRAA